MILLNKLVSFYFFTNSLTYILSSVVPNHLKVDVIDDNRETTISSEPSTTRLVEEAKGGEIFSRHFTNEVIPSVRKKSVFHNDKKNLDGLIKNIENMYTVSSSSLSPSVTQVNDFLPSSINTSKEMADKHFLQMIHETNCKTPRPKVIRVKEFYSDPHKTYYPSCTILHRCSEDTGCCSDITKKCSPHKTQNVTLHFTVGLVEKTEKVKYVQVYETLSFINHTECRCRANEETSMPRDTAESTNLNAIFPNFYRTQPLTKTRHRCKCPGIFVAHYDENGACTCNCNENKLDCINYIKGNIYFNYIDRHCIVAGHCSVPYCQYGVYSARVGRCPIKYDKFHYNTNV